MAKSLCGHARASLLAAILLLFLVLPSAPTAVPSAVSVCRHMETVTVSSRAVKVSTWTEKGNVGERKGLGRGERLRGGSQGLYQPSNAERWIQAGYDLTPDLSPENFQEVPLDVKLGDAAEYGDAEAVKKLLQAGANVNQVDFAGFSALHRAAFQGKLKVVELLIQAGANVNLQESGGRTPLHQAAAQGHLDVVEKLIQCGADAKIKDFPMPIDLDAIPGAREAIAELPPWMEDAGPDKLPLYEGGTAFDYATYEGYDDVAEYLRMWTFVY
uniref:Uncharacterized protein n=1 Tax=Guillardia theta TaxID=55529 RepID=A0A7S4PFA9_GUITH